MPPSSIETLSAFHCILTGSGLCTISYNTTCSQNLPKCDKDDACPEIDSLSSNTIPESESTNVAVKVITVILTLSGLMIVGFGALLVWTYFQSTVLEPKILSFDVYDPYDLPDTKPKYFEID
jgi:hypothetical protein